MKGVRDIQCDRNMKDFKKFIKYMELVDIPCVGGIFTWFKANGTMMSYLDKFLVSIN